MNDDKFSFIAFNEASILAMIFAIAYSLGTISVLSKARSVKLIYLYACLDAFGVLLYYFEAIPDFLRAFYFALYTGILIISTIYLDKPEYLTDQIIEMKQKGVSQRDIAQQLNLSESMVSRMLKRRNDS
jgi:hypothetical protein